MNYYDLNVALNKQQIDLLFRP